jgi:Ca2+-binding EF-hand superfamily protein
MGMDDITPEAVQLMMREADKDNDGSIDLHEFLEYFCKIVMGDQVTSDTTHYQHGA